MGDEVILVVGLVVDLAEAFEKRLGRRVDLISEDGVKPRFRALIEKDLRYV